MNSHSITDITNSPKDWEDFWHSPDLSNMQFQITDIEFDFTDDIGDGDTMDDFLTDDYKREIVDETMSTIWEACDEDDLIEEVTTAAGFCIKSIDYRIILN